MKFTETEKGTSDRRPLFLFFKLQLVALLVCAIFFRFWHLSNIPGINGDEAYTAYKAVRLFHGELAFSSEHVATNADSVPNTFYIGPLALLHAVFAPSVVLMRIVAVASGLLALGANFLLCRRAFDLRTASVSSMVLAVLPVNIAYSRFGWEPSQSLLITVLALYCCLLLVKEENNSLRWLALGCVALASAYVVHATNVFIAPFLAVAVAVRWWPEWKASLRRGASWKAKAALVLGIISLGGVVLLVLSQPAVQQKVKWHSAGEILPFLTNFERFFSGITTYRYIAGSSFWPLHNRIASVPDLHLRDVAVLLLGAMFLIFIGRSIKRHGETEDRALAIGWIASLVVFFFVAGPEALDAGNQRYGLALVAPAALLASRGIVVAFRQNNRLLPAVGGSLSVLGWVVLGGFYLNYFQFFRETGGQSHLAFRTGSIEPKEAALRSIRQSRQEGTRDFVIAPDWWSYWPLRYLSSQDQSIVVLHESKVADEPDKQGLDKAFRTGHLWFVQFTDESLAYRRQGFQASNIRQNFEKAKIPFEEREFKGYAGQKVIRLIRALPR